MPIITREEVDKSSPQHDVAFCTMRDVWSEVAEKTMSNPEAILGEGVSDWPLFSEYGGRCRPGEMIVITADTGMGKSTFAMNWAVKMVQQGRNICYVALENSIEDVARQMASMIYGLKFEPGMESDLLRRGYKTIEPYLDKIYFLERGYGMQKESFILKAISYAKKKYNCTFQVIDHLDAIEPEYAQTETTAQKNQIIRIFNQVKLDGTTLVVVHHPAKLQDRGGYKERDRGQRHISLDELKGSSAIKQVPDMVLTMRQPKNFADSAEIRFQKIRSPDFGWARNRKVLFGYDKNSFQYLELRRDQQ